MITTKKKKDTRIKKRNICLLIFIFIMSLAALYLIEGTNLLIPKLNEATASYISFNNSNSTDMLKITNIQKLNKKIGKSILNKKEVTFSIDGKVNDEFNIELYSIGNKLDKKYIHYILLEDNKEIKQGNLHNCEEKNDGGLILYQSTIKKDKQYKIKMWIDKKYENNVNNISYEVKIQSR